MHQTKHHGLLATTILSAVLFIGCSTSHIQGEKGPAAQPVIENDLLFSCHGELRFAVESQVDTTIWMDIAFVSDRSLMYERDTVLLRSVRTAVRGGVSDTVACSFRLNPGFYQVCANIGGTEIEPYNIGVKPESIVSEPDRKADFDEFWEATLAELASVPMEPVLTLLPEYSTADRNIYRVEIPSFGGVMMGGILAEPVAEGKYPTYIEYMGYGADVYYYNGSDRPETIQFLVSVRGQGIFKKPGDGRWIDMGIDSKEDFYYRGAFCDVVRAIDFVCSRPGCDENRLVAHGESQGGAFTWISAALDHRIKAIAPAVPFLSDYEDYSKIVWWPMWEVFETSDAAGISREDLFDTFTYFDIKNFTDRIQCPVLMGFGMQDPTCPPHTNFAGYNQVSSEKSYICYPLCGHGIWQVKEWADAREAFFKENMNKSY